jgi:hypothetical protein
VAKTKFARILFFLKKILKDGIFFAKVVETIKLNKKLMPRI